MGRRITIFGGDQKSQISVSEIPGDHRSPESKIPQKGISSPIPLGIKYPYSYGNKDPSGDPPVKKISEPAKEIIVLEEDPNEISG